MAPQAIRVSQVIRVKIQVPLASPESQAILVSLAPLVIRVYLVFQASRVIQASTA